MTHLSFAKTMLAVTVLLALVTSGLTLFEPTLIKGICIVMQIVMMLVQYRCIKILRALRLAARMREDWVRHLTPREFGFPTQGLMPEMDLCPLCKGKPERIIGVLAVASNMIQQLERHAVFDAPVGSWLEDGKQAIRDVLKPQVRR